MQTDITVFRGDTFAQPYQLTLNDVPVNITGWTFFLTIKQNFDDTDKMALISKTYVGPFTDPTNGRFTITMSAVETAPLEGNYYYDIQSKDSSGNILTFVVGQITFTPDITRRTT